jgi:hypothetical protein
MQATDLGNRNHGTHLRGHGGPAVRRVLVERQVGPGAVIVREVPSQHAAQVALAEHDQMVETLASDGADEPFDEGILPGTPGRRKDLIDAQALHAAPEGFAEDSVAITQQVRGRGVVREGVDDLLRRPGRGRVLGDVEVHHASPVMSEDEKHEEHAQAHGGHGEEVDRHQVVDVVGEERPPRLGGRRAPLREQPGDRALRDHDSQLQELAMNSRCAPQRIGVGHPGDEGDDVGARARPAHRACRRELRPVSGESTALPSQDGVGSHDHDRVSPPAPELGQEQPEETVGRPEPWPLLCALVHRQLLAQGDVFESEPPVAAAEERQESQHVKERGDHGTVILAESRPKHQRFRGVRILANDSSRFLGEAKLACTPSGGAQ